MRATCMGTKFTARNTCYAHRHLGFCDKRFTPTFRGFDHFTGYLNGAEDYWTHYRCNYMPRDEKARSANNTAHPIICSGVEGVRDDAKVNFLDFRNGSTPNVLAAACNRSFDDYSAFVFADEAVRVAHAHARKMATAQSATAAAQPLFVYAAMQSVHEPLQAPAEYLDR